MSKKILVAPLDWGLGHAARCVPVIRYLLEKNCEVIIGADQRPLALLRAEFPGLEYVVMPGYGITYPRKGNMALKMAVSVPRILAGIKREHEQLREVITRQKIDAVISDNRYGLWTTAVPCAFITHQLLIKSPFGEKLLHRLNKNYIKKFTQCWIPDRAGKDNLSGDLAHKFPLPPNALFIGPLSRFTRKGTAGNENEILVLLSGPEPQRTVLEQKLLEQLSPSGKNAVVVQGRTEKKEEFEKGKIRIVSYLAAGELEPLLRASKYLICRSGYSTIMDLAALGKKNIIFIPTPGQTEQEYLAERFMKNGAAYSVAQDKFELETALNECLSYKGFEKNPDDHLLEKTITGWLSSVPDKPGA